MAKTLSQIITDSRQIVGQTDASNSNFTDAQLTIWANEAYRRIVTALRFYPITSTDYTVSSASVTLGASTLTIDEAKIKNPDNSNKYQSLKIIDLETLLGIDPDYESATAAIPEYLVRTGAFTATLYPPPKSSVTALTTPLRTYGLNMPTDLSAGTDTPNLPGNLHDILCFWVAFRCFSFLNDEPRATQQITLFRGAIKEQRGVSIEFSKDLKGWRFPTVGFDDGRPRRSSC